MTNNNNNAANTEQAGAGRSKLLIFLPLILFGLLALFFIKGLFSDKGPRYIPSTLIGKTIPDFTLAPMTGLNAPTGGPMPTFSSKDLKKGKVSIINVWSSWCISCRAEHHFLQSLSRKAGVPIYGLNYKDTGKAGQQFLARFGNPYAAVGMDKKGRVGIDFGVYGVPETFIVDGKGVIRFKLPGPVNDAIIENQILPAINKARNSARK